MPKIVSAALKAYAWTKAIDPEANDINIGLKAP